MYVDFSDYEALDSYERASLEQWANESPTTRDWTNDDEEGNDDDND